MPTRLWGGDASFDYPMTSALDQDVARGEFKDDLCDCTRNCVPSCWGSLCCGGWLTVSQLCDRLGLAPRTHVLASGLLLFLIAYAVNKAWLTVTFAMVYTILALLIRRTVRKRYAIPGSMLRDVCTSVWLPSCVVAQAWRHVFPHRKAWHWAKLCDPYAGEAARQHQQHQHNNRAGVVPLSTATIV